MFNFCECLLLFLLCVYLYPDLNTIRVFVNLKLCDYFVIILCFKARGFSWSRFYGGVSGGCAPGSGSEQTENPKCSAALKGVVLHKYMAKPVAFHPCVKTVRCTRAPR